MSRTIDLFLDSDRPLDLVAAELSELVGFPLTGSPDRSRYCLQHGEVTAYLAEHDFLDDDDLPLSAFPYVLSAQVRGGDIDTSPEVLYLRKVNELWRQGSGLPSLLVVDLERLDISERWQSQPWGDDQGDDQGAAGQGARQSRSVRPTASEAGE
jgi:hypothetical protein